MEYDGTEDYNDPINDRDGDECEPLDTADDLSRLADDGNPNCCDE